LRILILANNAGGLYGFRAELLQSLVSRGFEVFFAVPQLSEDIAVQMIEAIGCQYIHTSMSRRGINPLEDLRLISRYQRVVQTVSPDLILTYTIKPNVYGNYVGNRLGVPVITNVTGIGSSLSSGKLKHLVKRMYKYACNKASIVFFQNQGNLDFFIENSMVSLDKVRLIPGSGVNLDKFTPMKKTNKDDGITRFLYIGRIMKDKGIEEYLDAANRITEQYPNTEFQILGSYEEEQYRELIENNPRVKYLGRSNDVREQIREVDCIVHPSYHEGMSNVLLEGAAMGKPLLASNIPGCKEIVDNGSNGYLFESKSVDSMIEKIRLFLALNDEQRMEMGLASRRKVEKEFDRNLVVEAYLQAINEIIDRK
jgi:galacturonosyltransferase